jgi:RimJ/RimL family protein N-acetyltransferase
MYTFERTLDMEQVRQIVTHPRVYGHVSDDSAPPASSYKPNPDLFYLLARFNDVLLGCWVFLQMEDAWEVHTCLLPNAYGRAKIAGRKMLDWLWQNTGAKRVTAAVPVTNKLAIALAKECGMVEFDHKAEAYPKNGKKHDVVLLEINRPEVKCP